MSRLASPPHWQIRPAQAPDLAAVAQIICQAFYGDPWWFLVMPVMEWGVYQDLRQRQHRSDPGYQCWIVTQPQAPMIIAALEIELRAVGPNHPYKPAPLFPYLSNMAVHPNYRRQGIAKQLLQRVIQELAEQNHTELYLHVLEQNTGARQLYEQVGFRQINQEQHWLLPSRLLLQRTLTMPA